MLISPSLSHSPFSKEKAHILINKHKDEPLQHLKHTIHLELSFKWALNKRIGEATTLGKDPEIVVGFGSPVVGRCSA